jgi:hypothetical protein
MSTIVGGGPSHTIILGASFHRAYYVVYVYQASTNAAEVRCSLQSSYAPWRDIMPAEGFPWQCKPAKGACRAMW